MSQAIYSRSQIVRKREFAIITLIKKTPSGLVVHKRALFPEARAHIQRLGRNFEVLRKELRVKNLAVVAPIAVNENEITFPFIHGETLEGRLVEQLMNEDTKGALESVQTVRNVIENLGTREVNPCESSGFRAVFGSSYASKTVCVRLGLLDVNLDNFIVADDGTIHLIDYEWLFDFPIPKHFVLSRMLFYFVRNQQDLLRFIASEKLPMVPFYKERVIPEFMLDRFRSELSPEETFLMAESNLQSAIVDVPSVFGARTGPQLHRPTKPSRGDIGVMQEQLAALRRDAVELQRQLRMIRNSRSYRLARMLARLYKLGSIETNR
jgi:hypothetical protein